MENSSRNGILDHFTPIGTIGKDPDAKKDGRQEEKGMTDDGMVGCHNQFYGHEFEQAPGVGDGQGSLSCCSPWDWSQTQLSN